MNQHSGKGGVGILRCPAGQLGGMIQRFFKLLLQPRVRCEPAVRIKVSALKKELQLQDVQPIKLGEQVGGRIGDSSHGVFGMKPLPLGETLVGLIELKVIHLSVALIEQSGLRARCRCQADDNPKDRRPGNNAISYFDGSRH